MASIDAGRRTAFPSRRALLRVAVVVGLTLATAAGAWLLASGSSSSSSTSKKRSQEVAQAQLLERAGVRLVRVAVSGGGGVLDLRYRVLDPDKAAIVHDPSKRPTIVDERTGEVIGEPFMGMWMHPRSTRPGVIHTQLFVNRGGVVRPGRRVTVILGGTRLQHVLVR